MFLRGQPVRKQASAFYPTARSLRIGAFLPYRDDLLSMFLRLRAFLPQELEQIVGVGLPPGHADKACIQLAEGFLDLPVLLGW